MPAGCGAGMGVSQEANSMVMGLIVRFDSPGIVQAPCVHATPAPAASRVLF